MVCRGQWSCSVALFKDKSMRWWLTSSLSIKWKLLVTNTADFKEIYLSNWGFDCVPGLSRSYSTGCSSSTLSDLDDIASLPDLFDLPLTPEEASEYCSLDLLGGGASAGNTSHSSSSSSSSSSSPLSNQNSPQQTILDGQDPSGLQLLHVHSQTHSLGHLQTVLDNLPDDCSIPDLGKCKET